MEAEERQARANARKQSQEKVIRIEKEILRLEERQKEITAQLEDPKIYHSGGDVMTLNRELLTIAEALENLNESWHEALSHLETAAAG